MSDTNTEELQKKLEQALASIDKLTAKNAEILEENKKRKSEAEAARDAAEELAANAEREGKDVAALEARLTAKHAKEMTRLQADLQARDAKLNTLLVDNAIATALAENNVAPQFAKAVTAMLKTDAKVINGEALLGDLPINDGIKSFMSSDDAKVFIAAPANSGANAIGSRASGSALPATWNLTEYLTMKTNDPAVAASYAEKHGKTF